MAVRPVIIREFMDLEVITLEFELLHGDPQQLELVVADAQRKVKQMGLWAAAR